MNELDNALYRLEKLERLESPDFGWHNWTPVPTNFTVGDGTIAAKYQRIGQSMEIDVILTLGSSSAVGTSPSLTLPVTAVDRGVWQVLYVDTGTAFYVGRAEALTASLCFYRYYVSGNDLQTTAIGATVPFTWATGDIIYIHGLYGAVNPPAPAPIVDPPPPPPDYFESDVMYDIIYDEV